MNTLLLPLCVDLDGTLVGTDTFDESVAKALRSPRALLALLRALPGGKARAKAVLARHCRPEAHLLPYNEPFLAFLGAQKKAGRTLVLVTAANEDIARSVARHVGLFDEVLASTPTRNLRGMEKGKALMERFGRRGFVYAGNDHTDLEVWPLGAAAIVVSAPRAVAAALEASFVECAFPRVRERSFARLVRVAEAWKNLLALVPLALLPGTAPLPWGSAAGAFSSLCLLFAALYVLNDLLDLEDDRAAQRDRPLARGCFPVRAAFAAMAVAGLAAAAAALALGAGLTTGAIAVLSVLYSARLQRVPVAGVVALAGLYLGRLAFGAAVLGTALTPLHWGWAAAVSVVIAVVGRHWWPALDET